MKTSARGVVAALTILVAAAVCVRLGFWQLERLEQRRARNTALGEALALPPIPLDSAVLAKLEVDPTAFANRRGRAVGAYDHAREMVLRGRSRDGQPGIQIVTPLRIQRSGAAVLVNRGWAPSPDAATVELDSLREPGVQSVQGLIQPLPATGSGWHHTRSAGNDVRPVVQRLDTALVNAWLPYPVPPVVLQQLPDSARSRPPLRVALPPFSNGPHLGYAVQWFSFALIAIVGFGVVVLRSRRSI